MEWTDASGTTCAGAMIPPLATDTTGGAFPGGSVRWTNVGSEGGKAFDLFRVGSDGQSLPVNVTNGARRPTYVDWDPLWKNDLD